MLHRLSVFRSAFTLDAAVEVAGCERIGRSQVISSVLDLVSRSLIEREGEHESRYRLLFVARLYASERLVVDGDAPGVVRRHAICIRDGLARANEELRDPMTTLSHWRATHVASMPDVRAALDWAHGPGGDAVLGAQLVIESGRLQLETGLNDEFLPRALAALGALTAAGDAPPELTAPATHPGLHGARTMPPAPGDAAGPAGASR